MDRMESTINKLEIPAEKHFDRRAEQGLLGCILLDPVMVFGGLGSNYFEKSMYCPEHRLLFDTMQVLFAELGDTMTPPVVFHYLKQHNLMDGTGGEVYFTESIDKETCSETWGYYRDVMQAAYEKRQQCKLAIAVQDFEGTSTELGDYVKKLTGAMELSGKADEPDSWLDVITLSEIEPEELEYLQPDIIPMGMLTALNSLEGTGKSHVAADIIARVTTGTPWQNTPTERNKKGDVILYSREEHLSKTIVPRLLAHEADMTRIHIVRNVVSKNDDKHIFELEYDMANLYRLMKRFPKTRLVCFDPITQYIAGNENSNHDVQRALDVLTEFAEQHNVAILMISHFNKKGAAVSPINRMIGSRAFSTSCRIIWALEFDPKSDDDDVYMVCTKCNIGPRPLGFRFHISGPTGRGKVYWDVSRTSRLLGEGAEKTTKLEECCKWVREKLADDAKIPATEIYAEGDALGFNEIMLKRAKKEMSIISIKEGFGADGRSFWQNPIIQSVSEGVD